MHVLGKYSVGGHNIFSPIKTHKQKLQKGLREICVLVFKKFLSYAQFRKIKCGMPSAGECRLIPLSTKRYWSKQEQGS